MTRTSLLILSFFFSFVLLLLLVFKLWIGSSDPVLARVTSSDRTLRRSVKLLPARESFFYDQIALQFNESDAAVPLVEVREGHPRVSIVGHLDDLNMLPEKADSVLNFTLSVGVFKGRNQAKKLVERLQHNGYNSYYLKEKVGGRNRYLVRSGFFESKPEADRLALALKEEGVQATVIPTQ